MRILFLTTDLPYPPYAGAPLRNFGLIRGLAQQNTGCTHDLWLMCFQSHDQIDPAETPLAELCREVTTITPPQRSTGQRLRDLLLTTQADMAHRFLSDAFAAALRDLLRRQPFDLVQIENLEMAVYLPVIKEIQPETPVIYDAHNAEYALQQRIYETDRANLARLHAAAYSYMQSRRLRRFERDVCAGVDHIVAVSETDAGLLRELGMATPVTVVPNGINMLLYKAPPVQPLQLDGTALVFTGKMDYRPNVDAVLWFVGDVLPRIRRAIPDAHFYIVGQTPHRRLGVLYSQPGVTLTGFVPRVLPYLQAADVFVVPLRMGSGTRLKVLEAMAAAKPIVSTRIGAQGLDTVGGDALLLADDAESFAQAVITLHEDSARAAALGQRARAFVSEHYDWPVIIPRLCAVYEGMGLG